VLGKRCGTKLSAQGMQAKTRKRHQLRLQGGVNKQTKKEKKTLGQSQWSFMHIKYADVAL